MKTQQLQAAFKGGNVKLALFLYIEEGVQVCYAPELDLFGYGYTEQEALDSFTIALDNYLAYVMGHKTLKKDLTRLGWSYNDRQMQYTAPALHELLLRNKDFSRTLTERPYRKVDRLVALSA